MYYWCDCRISSRTGTCAMRNIMQPPSPPHTHTHTHCCMQLQSTDTQYCPDHACRFSGPTVHFVDEEYDTGPILAQRCVPVFPTDSPQQLAARVLKEVRAGSGQQACAADSQPIK